MAYLHISLFDFYDYTPKEIDCALKFYFDKVSEEHISSWERTRLSIYYGYIFIPSKKQKVSYDEFKRKFLPLGFDVHKEEQVIDDDLFDNILSAFDSTKNKKEETF